MPRSRSLVAVTVVSMLALNAPAIGAQGQPGPPAPENLKVLPKDIPRDSLMIIMRGFTQALGVRCEYCHVVEPASAATGGRERFHFAADDKVPKQKARFMLRMVDTLNRVTLAALPDRHTPPITVSCVTCHRGLPVPQTLMGVLYQDVERFGTDTAVKHYNALRQDMASGRYDFSEGSVNDLARELAGHGKVAEAITMLEMNQSFYPGSAEIDDQLGELFLQRNDRDRAIVHFRAALVKRPNDTRAQQHLRQFGVQPGVQPSAQPGSPPNTPASSGR